ncbi:MAG: zinc ribbon domain-containing protein [Methanosarcinales archaeon]
MSRGKKPSAPPTPKPTPKPEVQEKPVLEGKGGEEEIVIGVKPKEPGNIPLNVAITFTDAKNNPYSRKDVAYISVAKESETITMQQVPVIQIGSYVGQQVDIKDSVVQRTKIGEGAPTAKKCPNCGQEVQEGDKFCNNCGAKLS